MRGIRQKKLPPVRASIYRVRMLKRKKIKIILAVIFLLLFALFFWGYASRTTVNEVENFIEKEAPIGSSMAQVEATLKEHHFTHFSYYDGLDGGNFDDKPEKLRGIAKGYIGAIKRNVEWDWMIRWDIMARFYFNEHGELLDYTVRRIGTGP
jgi:hypothetical protein